MREEKFSTACLIVGIISCVMCCMCLGFPIGIVGIVLFVLSTGNGHGINIKAGFGLALSIVGVMLSTLALIFFILTNIQGIRDRFDYYPYDYYDNYDDGFDNFDDYDLPIDGYDSLQL